MLSVVSAPTAIFWEMSFLISSSSGRTRGLQTDNHRAEKSGRTERQTEALLGLVVRIVESEGNSLQFTQI